MEDRPERDGAGEGEGLPTITRVLASAPDPAPEPVLPTRTSRAAGSSVGASTSLGDALLRDEAGRVSIFARLTLLLCLLGLAFSPVYGGDPLAKRILIAALGAASATSIFVIWMTHRPARYRESRVIVALQIQETCATSAA